MDMYTPSWALMQNAPQGRGLRGPRNTFEDSDGKVLRIIMTIIILGLSPVALGLIPRMVFFMPIAFAITWHRTFHKMWLFVISSLLFMLFLSDLAPGWGREPLALIAPCFLVSLFLFTSVEDWRRKLGKGYFLSAFGWFVWLLPIVFCCMIASAYHMVLLFILLPFAIPPAITVCIYVVRDLWRGLRPPHGYEDLQGIKGLFVSFAYMLRDIFSPQKWTSPQFQRD